MAGTGGGGGIVGRGAAAVAAAAGGLRAAARRAASLPDALHLRLLGLLPAPLRTDRFARGFYAAAALFAWIAATAAAVVALFAPFATPAQKLAALLFAWTPLALPVWRGAAASVRLARARRLGGAAGAAPGEASGALARWRPAMLRRGRLGCLPVAALAGWFAVACSTAAVAAVAWQAARDAAGLPGFPGGAGRAWAAALLLLALGGAALVGMGRFFAARLEADPALPGNGNPDGPAAAPAAATPR